MHKERIIKSLFHALLLLLFTGAAAVIPARPSLAGERPLVQYDDTDVAPPMPDAGDPDPLFEDPDPGAEITDPFEDGLGPDDPEPADAPDGEATDDYPAAE